MTRDAARELFRRMLADLRVSQRVMALLVGRDELTVNRYARTGVIPATSASWIEHIQEISIQPGRAVIVIGLPPDVPTSEYRRFPSENDKRPRTVQPDASVSH